MADTEDSAEFKHFKLTDDGKILFQPDQTNPLPGEPVGYISKGASLMQPAAELTNTELDKQRVQSWLQSYIAQTLDPLFIINDEETIQPCAREITKKLYEALGILPRADLEELIAELDEEGRKALRQRKVRLGPVLVFLPLLSKPASVRLRALLWNIWNGEKLPIDVPGDGVTSISIEPKDIDPVYYRAIGYPVYGRRAIRVDMLDRLIVAVYDGADKGIFKAKHEMAEWLGCPISDLYEILEAMDHKKIYDPANEAEESKAEETSTELQEKAEQQVQDQESEKAKESKAENNSEKPELATFKLRRGRAYGKAPITHKKQAGKKVYKKQQKAKPKRGVRKAKAPEKERVISAMAERNEENNPFAALKELKVQNKE